MKLLRFNEQTKIIKTMKNVKLFEDFHNDDFELIGVYENVDYHKACSDIIEWSEKSRKFVDWDFLFHGRGLSTPERSRSYWDNYVTDDTKFILIDGGDKLIGVVVDEHLDILIALDHTPNDVDEIELSNYIMKNINL